MGHNSQYSRYAILVTIALIFSTFLAGCSSSPARIATANDSDKTESIVQQEDDMTIAASIGDIEVTEQEVSDYISQYRLYIGAEDDIAFATLLDEAGQTPSDIREQAIEKLLSQKMLRQRAQDSGISVSEEDIDRYIEDIRDGLGYAMNDNSWQSVLDITGYDSEEDYRYDIESKMLLEALVAEQIGDKGSIASESEMMVLANSDVASYTGMYIIETIFSASSGMRANRFAVSVEGDSLEEFKDAAADSVEEGVAREVIETGWTCLNQNLSGAAASALSGSYAGDVVMWQEDDGTYHVAYISEVFYPTSTGKVDYQNLPDAIRSKLASDASSEKMKNLANDYMRNLLTSGSISFSDMPSNAPYNVDMTLSTYEPPEEEEEITSELISEE